MLTQEQIDRYIMRHVVQNTAEMSVVLDHRGKPQLRFIHIKPAFALRMAKRRYGGNRPLYLRPYDACAAEQREDADLRPIWGLRYARELIEAGEFEIPEEKPAVEPEPSPTDVATALELHFGRNKRSARAVGGAE